MSNRVYRSTIFRNPWKRRRLAAGHFPAADRLPIGCPDAFHWQRVTDWSSVGGRVAQWNALSVSLSVCVCVQLSTSQKVVLCCSVDQHIASILAGV